MAARKPRAVRWLEHGKPIPRGWRMARQMVTHHTRFGRVIERKPGKKK